VTAIHPDVYQPHADEWNADDREAHEEAKHRESEICKARWQRQERKL
jgi:hypothetical protein